MILSSDLPGHLCSTSARANLVQIRTDSIWCPCLRSSRQSRRIEPFSCQRRFVGNRNIPCHSWRFHLRATPTSLCRSIIVWVQPTAFTLVGSEWILSIEYHLQSSWFVVCWKLGGRRSWISHVRTTARSREDSNPSSHRRSTSFSLAWSDVRCGPTLHSRPHRGTNDRRHATSENERSPFTSLGRPRFSIAM